MSAVPKSGSMDSRALFARLIDEALAARRLATLVIPAPHGPLTSLWRATRDEPAFYWRRADGTGLASAGEIAAFPAPARHDPARAEDARRELAREVLALGAPPSSLPASLVAPVLVGGAPFDDARGGGPWTELGTGGFALPRLVYWRDREHAFVIAALDARRPDAAARARALQTDYEALVRHLAENGEFPRAPRPRCQERLEEPPRETWIARVEDARRAIAAGHVRKVVLARRTMLRFDAAPDVADALARLALPASGVRVFGVRRGAASLIGASPETLFEKRGQRVQTEALAGTAALAHEADRAEDAARRLLASAKDALEQGFVVRAIEDALAPLAETVRVSPAPRPRAAGNVVHLSTPIEAFVHEGVSWAHLLAALHPTPAVGGAPREAALALLRETEMAPRGWYAGPIGIVDLATGDAEIGVAIRSALIVRECAWVHAGAGIVAPSDPAAEYEETASKQHALFRALGVEP